MYKNKNKENIEETKSCKLIKLLAKHFEMAIICSFKFVLVNIIIADTTLTQVRFISITQSFSS